jgi:hypothetical protein
MKRTRRPMSSAAAGALLGTLFAAAAGAFTGLGATVVLPLVAVAVSGALVGAVAAGLAGAMIGALLGWGLQDDGLRGSPADDAAPLRGLAARPDIDELGRESDWRPTCGEVVHH